MKGARPFLFLFAVLYSMAVSGQELTIPSANTNGSEKAEYKYITQAALINSRILWGKVSMGTAIPLSDFKGDIIAYEISFSTKYAEFPDYDEIMESIRRGRTLREEAYITGDKRLCSFGERLRWGIDSYRTIIIAARYDMYPIPEYSTGLSPFYTTGDLAKQKAAGFLGASEIKLTRMYYAGHLSRWFEFTAQDGRKILVDVYSLELYQPGEILTEQLEQNQNPEELQFIEMNNKAAWEKLKAGARIINSVRAAAQIEGVPFYDWSFGCSPTASAMILGYYNDKGYQKLIDYYFDRWDPVEQEWDYDIPNVQRELAQAMKTDFSDGSTYISDIPPGNIYVTNNINGYNFESDRSAWGGWSNNFNWDLIKKEIDARRPFHWIVLDYWSSQHRDHVDHSVAAVGYTNDHYVIVHNTWDTREHNWYYYTDTGGKISFSYVINIIPRGNHPPYLQSIGSKSIREGSELTFRIIGKDPDNDPITFSVKNLPAGAAFNPATRTFSWTPTYTQSGTCTVRFIVSDAVYSDYEDVEIMVVDVKKIIPKP
jgi:frataxin-like iron-binding protein CyaY